MLYNSNDTALTKFRGATEKADKSIDRLENTLLMCFVCENEGAAELNFTLYKCCGKHHVCHNHHNKHDLVSKLVDGRGGFTTRKCAHPKCLADAISPPERLDKSACALNKQVYDTLIILKDASHATKDFEKECDKERAIVLNRADVRVASAENGRQQAENALELSEAARQQAEADRQQAEADRQQAQDDLQQAQFVAPAVGNKRKKAQVIAEDGREAWDNQQRIKKERVAERLAEREVNKHNSMLADILPPQCIHFMGQTTYESWLADKISAAAGPSADEPADDAEDE